MKKNYWFILFIATLSRVEESSAQPTTAMDFTMNDCATGQMHNLYSILDSGNVVIMEFFMINCYPCVDAGKALDSMYKKLKVSCPDIRFFETSFNNTDKCSAVFNWVDTNGFSSVPFDSGAAQIAYYGFFGMPTVAVAAGNTHKLIYLLTSGGFQDSDTAVIADSIKAFCATSGIHNTVNNFTFSVYPIPAADNFTLRINAAEPGDLKIELMNVLGEKRGIITEEKIKTGSWVRTISSATIPKGIYLLKVQLNHSAITYKIIIR